MPSSKPSPPAQLQAFLLVARLHNFSAAARELGISVGNKYQLDIFHAERHTSGSNFHLETTIACFVAEIG